MFKLFFYFFTSLKWMGRICILHVQKRDRLDPPDLNKIIIKGRRKSYTSCINHVYSVCNLWLINKNINIYEIHLWKEMQIKSSKPCVSSAAPWISIETEYEHSLKCFISFPDATLHCLHIFLHPISRLQVNKYILWMHDGRRTLSDNKIQL